MRLVPADAESFSGHTIFDEQGRSSVDDPAHQLNLGGSLEMLQNPVAIVEMAVDKKANTVLMPVSARRALNDLPDEYLDEDERRVLQRTE